MTVTNLYNYSSDRTDTPLISHPAEAGLTSREIEVLQWLIRGKSNKAIARHLGIEEQTVKNHLRSIYLKYDVTSRAELIVTVLDR